MQLSGAQRRCVLGACPTNFETKVTRDDRESATSTRMSIRSFLIRGTSVCAGLSVGSFLFAACAPPAEGEDDLSQAQVTTPADDAGASSTVADDAALAPAPVIPPTIDAGAEAPAVPPIYVAPSGRPDAPGTLDAPTALTAAITRVKPGQTIFLRGGTYASAVQITIGRDNSGAQGAPKRLFAYEGETPVLDFSTQPYGASNNQRGLQINGHFWHVRGLVVQRSADNGIYVAGNGNVIERCVTRANRDTGLQLGRHASSAAKVEEWPRDNLVLNCESYDNYDAPPGSGENADGFAAKLTVGPGNVFRGCVAHHNIDDGWDLYTKGDTGPIGSVTIDQSVAHHNGTLTDGRSNAQGDRNGFKLGGEKIAVAHVVTRSVAYANGKNGFTWNSNPGAIQLSNTLAFDNAEGNYRFGDNATPTAAVFTNNVSLRTAPTRAKADKVVGRDTPGTNVWTGAAPNARGLTATVSDFAASLTAITLARAADGSLDFSPFALAAGSRLINAGALPAGKLPFDAATAFAGLPDLGAVEAR